MWEQDWGTMIWGGGAQVPTMGPFGWLLLGALVGAAGVLYRRPLSKAGTAVALLAIGVVPLSALAVPHLFTNGTVADADEVNANFADIESALPNLAYSGEFIALKNDQTLGTVTTSMGSSTDRVCFLTHVLHQGGATDSDDPVCWAREVNGTWYLQATALGAGLDVDCRARCLTW